MESGNMTHRPVVTEPTPFTLHSDSRSTPGQVGFGMPTTLTHPDVAPKPYPRYHIVTTTDSEGSKRTYVDVAPNASLPDTFDFISEPDGELLRATRER